MELIAQITTIVGAVAAVASFIYMVNTTSDGD